MNYYKRHLGDYAKDTKTLTVYEHGVYSILLDYYYSEESPISNEDATALVRPANARERASMQKVLSRYFKPDGDTWRHNYADRVIAASKEKAEKNRENGNLGGRPSKILTAREQEPKENPDGFHNGTEAEPKNNLIHKPLATSHKPVKKDSPLRAEDRPRFEKFYKAYPRHEARADAERAFAKLRPDDALVETMLAAIERQRKGGQWAEGFIPFPATWLNGRRWEDEPMANQPAKHGNGQAAWWLSDATTEAKGRELGISAKPGESMQQYVGRIRAKLEEHRAA